MNEKDSAAYLSVLTSSHLEILAGKVREEWENHLEESGMDIGDATLFEDTKLLQDGLPPAVNWWFKRISGPYSFESGLDLIQDALKNVRRYVTWMAEHMLDDDSSGSHYQRMFEAIKRLPVEIEQDIAESIKDHNSYKKQLALAVKNSKTIPKNMRQEEEDFEYLSDNHLVEKLITYTLKAIDLLASLPKTAEEESRKELQLLLAAQDYCEFRGRSRKQESRERFQKMYELA